VITLSAGYLAYTENERYVLLSGLEAFDNEIAHIMTVGTGVAFFLGLQSKHWWEKLIAFACAALMVHTVMFHMSRGAMLGIGVVGVATFVIVPKKPRDLALYALAIIVGLQLAGPSVRSEFSTIFSSDRKVQNDGGRRQLWADMWDAANRNVVFGLGPGHWPVVAREYGWPAGKQGHGLWPQILAETGFPGGILYASVFATPILLLWRHARRGVKDGDETLVWFARMAIASLAGFIVQELFGSFVGLEIAYYVVMLGGGTLKLISLAPAQDRSAALTRELLGDWSRVRPQHVEVYG
jgi:O-antigen ligase